MRPFRLAFRRTFTSLRVHRNYRLFFAGQVVSLCGTWMQNVALYWLILTLTNSAVAVGLLSLARFGPSTLFGLFAGVVADRFDNRRTVMVTQTVQMALSAALAAVAFLGAAQPWELYLIAALIGTVVVFDLAARQTFTVQLVGREELSNAVALNSSIFNLSRIVGPAIAGVVIATVGSAWCFTVNTVSFLAVLAGIVAIRASELYPVSTRTRPSLWGGTREGLDYVVGNRRLAVLVGLGLLVFAFSFNLSLLLPVLTKQTLHGGPRTFGVLSAIFGAGALAGALVSAAVALPRLRWILGGTAVFGFAELVLAPLHSVPLAAVILFVCGFSFSVYTTSSNARVQLEAPDHLRGRVIGIYFYAWNGPVALASPVLGWLCNAGGTMLAFSVSGACALLTTAAAAFALRRPAAEPAPLLEPA